MSSCDLTANSGCTFLHPMCCKFFWRARIPAKREVASDFLRPENLTDQIFASMLKRDQFFAGPPLWEKEWLPAQKAFYNERRQAKKTSAAYHGVGNPSRPIICKCARNFETAPALKLHRRTCRMGDLTPNRETLGTAYKPWCIAMRNLFQYYRGAVLLPLIFIARLKVRWLVAHHARSRAPVQ